MLFTTPLSLLGDAAPGAWLVVARTAGIVTVILAYRLGRRLGSPLAGVLAAVAIVLIPGWFQEQAFGGELGPLLALSLGAIDRHLAGRPTQALLLGFGTALLRVEAWPFLLLYGLWVWRKRTVDRRLVAAAVVLLPVLWFVPDWVTLGDPFRGSEVAQASTELETDPPLDRPMVEVARRAYELVALPVLLLAAAAVTMAVRRRQWTVIVLGAGALAWVSVVAVMAEAGYPGLPRFMVPVAAVICILGAVGATEVADLAGRRRRPVVSAAVVWAAVVVALLPSTLVRGEDLANQARTARAWERFVSGLEAAVGRAGGAERTACRRPTVSHAGLTALAWTLGLPLASIRTSATADSLVFSARNPALAKPPPISVDLPRRLVVRNPEWEVYELGKPPATTAGCPRRFR